jgi:hypothetical protein
MFTGSLNLSDGTIWTYEGTWSVSGDVVRYYYTRSSSKRVPIGTQDEDKLLEITGDSYTVLTRDGATRRYKRLQ